MSITLPDLPPRIFAALETIKRVSDIRYPYVDGSVISPERELRKEYESLEKEAIRLLKDYMRGSLDIDHEFYGRMARSEKGDGDEGRVPVKT